MDLEGEGGGEGEGGRVGRGGEGEGGRVGRKGRELNREMQRICWNMKHDLFSHLTHAV